jgi:predicted nuclease of predicted toxin-antitoxin system
VKFLLDANMPRSSMAVMESRGHMAEHVSDVGLGHADDSTLFRRARVSNAVLVTRDLDFADIRRYPPAEHAGIIVVRVPDDWGASRITGLLGSFLDMTGLVAQMPGHLAILDPRQARFRPALP